MKRCHKLQIFMLTAAASAVTARLGLPPPLPPYTPAPPIVPYSPAYAYFSPRPPHSVYRHSFLPPRYDADQQYGGRPRCVSLGGNLTFIGANLCLEDEDYPAKEIQLVVEYHYSAVAQRYKDVIASTGEILHVEESKIMMCSSCTQTILWTS